MSHVRLTALLIAVALWHIPAGAQSVTQVPVPMDGPAPVVTADSLETRINRGVTPMPDFSTAMSHELFSKMLVPPFETRQARAYRANINAVHTVIPSVRRDLSQSFVKMSRQQYMLMALSGLFLTPQFAIPYGYRPLMNQSNPFVTALIPGGEPVYDMYSPEVIPQAVELDYDFATGTYKQRMVDWNVFQQRMSTINPSNFNITPVPRVPLNDVERRIMSGNF